MSAAEARRRAERCYAVARSTTHEGERQAAIGRGDAICRSSGLDPADFDVPGRSRRAQQKRERARDQYSARDIRDAMERLRRSMEGWQERAFADALRGETAYDASRRNFDAAAAAAKERDQARIARDELRGFGIRVDRAEAGGWLVEYGGVFQADDRQLIELAQQCRGRVLQRGAR